ncbi:AAA family ATPase [Salinarimonas sp.]|uniref:AAA family ATPase n=1 Tax=Salinarimonas sp. TaxID=2766526 RepID=UPI0032D947E2
MARVWVAGDAATDLCLLKLPPRGGEAGADPTFTIWIEDGGVRLSARTLVGLGFETELLAVEGVDGESLHSLVSLGCLTPPGKAPEAFDPAPDRSKKPVHARVQSFDGYFEGAPLRSHSGALAETGAADAVTARLEAAEAIFLNDAGRSTRHDAAAARRLATLGPTAKIVLHKRHPPLLPKADGPEPLLEALDAIDGPEKLLIVSANDLRTSGQRLRGHLSWDAALEDLAKALHDRNGVLSRLREHYTRVLVQFDVEALALISEAGAHIDFVFHPSSAEGDQAHERPGFLYGQMNALSCALLTALRDSDWRIDRDVLEQALTAVRRYARGHITIHDLKDASRRLEWPDIEKTAAASAGGAGELRHVALALADIQPGFRLIRELERDTDQLALDIVTHGEPRLRSLPAAIIGKFATVDRAEIESYRTIQRLIDRYLADGSATKPLSIGVFGPPGSGKSFGIKQIAQQRGIPMLEFNLSEAEPAALPGYFHVLRDMRLRGKTPLCFFDEFDSNGRQLVARFLAPMQDGEFRDGDRVHPVGRAILVFAGGTARTADDFVGSELEAGDAKLEEGRTLKVPDFASRLSATLDIRGPNPLSDEEDAGAHLLRRAVLLRSLLEKTFPQVVTDGRARAAVAADVVQRFLDVEHFTYGARSIEQVLKMCAVPAGQARLEVSDLPDAERIRLHVDDADGFFGP